MNFIRRRIDRLRQQPEEVRLAAVGKFTIVSGIILVLLWLLIFLPLQVRSRPNAAKTPLLPEGLIQPLAPESSPTITPIPRPNFSQPQSNSGTPSVKLLPTTEDQSSPTPTPSSSKAVEPNR